MKLAGFRADYYKLSGKASDVARKLAFAGIAIVWIFRAGEGSNFKVPHGLLLPLFVFAITLALDLLHYVAGAIIWGVFCRVKECAGVAEDEELDAPPWLNYPTLVFFWGKILGIGTGYFFLIRFLWEAWSQ